MTLSYGGGGGGGGSGGGGSSGGGSRRMLRLELTDGHATVTGIEYRELTGVKPGSGSGIAPGIKVALARGAQVKCQHGILLFQGDALTILVGRYTNMVSSPNTTPLRVTALPNTTSLNPGAVSKAAESRRKGRAECVQLPLTVHHLYYEYKPSGNPLL